MRFVTKRGCRCANVQIHRSSLVDSRALVHINNRLDADKLTVSFVKAAVKVNVASREGTACAIAALDSSLMSLIVFA